MRNAQSAGIVLILILSLFAGGCDVIMSLLGSATEGGGDSSAICKQAAECYGHLDHQGSDEDLIEMYEKENGKAPGWPNAKVSWAARQDKECQTFINFVDAKKDALKKDHPSFKPKKCGF